MKAKGIVPVATEYDNTYLIWIVLLLIITLFYVGKSTLHIGMGFLAFIYCVCCILFYKWVSSKTDFATEFNGVKGLFDSNTSLLIPPNTKYFLAFLAFFIIFIILVSITFLYGETKIPNSNDWWISADIFLSIIIAISGFALISYKRNQTAMFFDASFYGLCAIFAGTVIWNVVNLAKITNVINKRSASLGTYDMGSGNLNKDSLGLTTGFLVLFYFLVAFLMATVYFSMSQFHNFKGFIISFLCAIIITIINHFLTKKIIEKVPNDALPTKAEKEKDTSQKKVQNQNVFSSAYYSILLFFNNPSII
jgi:hypothetical protein